MARGAGAGRSAAVCPWARLDGGEGGGLVLRADLRICARPTPPCSCSYAAAASWLAWAPSFDCGVVEHEAAKCGGGGGGQDEGKVTGLHEIRCMPPALRPSALLLMQLLPLPQGYRPSRGHVVEFGGGGSGEPLSPSYDSAPATASDGDADALCLDAAGKRATQLRGHYHAARLRWPEVAFAASLFRREKGGEGYGVRGSKAHGNVSQVWQSSWRHHVARGANTAPSLPAVHSLAEQRCLPSLILSTIIRRVQRALSP